MTDSKKQKLTGLQARFVDEYIVDLSAKHAAIRAGYSPSTAHQIGYANLGKQIIIDAIREKQRHLAEKCEVSATRVIKEHASIGLHNIRDYYNDDGTAKQLGELNRDQLAAVKGFKKAVIPADKDSGREEQVVIVDYFFHKKDKPLEALSKHLGLFEADNQQQGTADLKSRQEFMKDLMTAIDGKSLGLPGKGQDGK